MGASRFVRCDAFEQIHWWFWFPDGGRLLVLGAGADKKRLCLCVPICLSELYLVTKTSH